MYMHVRGHFGSSCPFCISSSSLPFFTAVASQRMALFMAVRGEDRGGGGKEGGAELELLRGKLVSSKVNVFRQLERQGRMSCLLCASWARFVDLAIRSFWILIGLLGFIMKTICGFNWALLQTAHSICFKLASFINPWRPRKSR